ncbi:MAG: hypothetical protein ABL962_04040 [Fimbriimonadaceae bacterium]
MVLLALGISLFTGQRDGLIGVTLGLASTTFSLFALRWVIAIVCRPFTEPSEPWWRTCFIIFVFLLKVPILGGAIWVVQQMGSVAMGHFLAGLFLVYSAMVGWALTRGVPQ